MKLNDQYVEEEEEEEDDLKLTRMVYEEEEVEGLVAQLIQKEKGRLE